MLADSDHTLSSHRVRAALIDEVVAWINHEFPVRAAVQAEQRNHAGEDFVMAGRGPAIHDFLARAWRSSAGHTTNNR
jgi:cytidylate kinase